MYIESMASPLKAQQGLTLIELIVFIVIVSVGLAGVLSALNVAVRGSADPLQPKQSLAIAEAMLEEVLIKDFENPSGGYAASCPATCDRSQMDDVSDYANYDVTGVKDLTGASVGGLGSYRVRVGITTDALCKNPGTSASEAKKITVTVTSPAGDNFTLSGYRCKF